MKFKIIIVLSTLFIVTSILIFYNSTQQNEQNKITDKTTYLVGYKYTIKSYKGKIAVFENKENKIIEIIDCPINTLPEYEIKELESGIEIQDDEQLQQFIEAYD